ncbi:PepSY domain-containing protein [Erythrobacter sp. WH131]|uniref:PepSY domain-containing protein n=1 Tax=Erythrobacter ani TaxID=2827235 RepID=A0ABS6SQR7_9SPHN|nr:PepSY domain-containing protein [Erythrobacter ani]
MLGSKLHKWLAVFVGVQVLLWMITGALMSFLDIEEVRSEHVVSRAPEVLPADAVMPEWLDSREGVVSLATRAVAGRAVTEVRRDDGSVTLRDPDSGMLISPLPAASARAIARRAWTGPPTTVATTRLIEDAVGTEFRGPFPAWQITYGDEDNTRVYIDASSGSVLAARSDTWRLFDFVWGLHIMDWTQRDRINSWWLLLFGIGGTIIAVSGFVLLANRFPWIRRRAKHVPNAP